MKKQFCTQFCQCLLTFFVKAFVRERKKTQAGRRNAASYELIPFVLSQCGTLEEAKEMLVAVNLTGAAFDEQLPAAQLHWMIADASGALTAEPAAFVRTAGKSFLKNLDLQTYSRGMGALGLPGDLSSASHFVRAAFVRQNSISGQTEEESVGQFFRIFLIFA